MSFIISFFLSRLGPKSLKGTLLLLDWRTQSRSEKSEMIKKQEQREVDHSNEEVPDERYNSETAKGKGKGIQK